MDVKYKNLQRQVDELQYQVRNSGGLAGYVTFVVVSSCFDSKETQCIYEEIEKLEIVLKAIPTVRVVQYLIFAPDRSGHKSKKAWMLSTT